MSTGRWAQRGWNSQGWNDRQWFAAGEATSSGVVEFIDVGLSDLSGSVSGFVILVGCSVESAELTGCPASSVSIAGFTIQPE